MTREEFTVQAEAVSGSLRRFLTALCCGDCSTADDIAQEALIKAYLSSEGLRDETKFRAWIFRITYNCFISHRRALGAAPAAVSTEDESARSVYSGDSADGAFRYQALYAALDRLGPRERSAILLYYMQGYSVRETAGIVEASEEAVKQYLSRGRRHLRGLLENE